MYVMCARFKQVRLLKHELYNPITILTLSIPLDRYDDIVFFDEI